ncbi:hypothetical protein ABW20_dc0109670 [Dactylellina cionopaga]|nr:hypothetical protein ABW20_dc0109670 [Dactylellina cionopaga]
MLVLSGLLLGLVFIYRITGSSLIVVDGEPEAGAYFVKISATSFTTVASWSSSLAPLLPGLIMTLAFFPVASKIRTYSITQDRAQLPTPYQLNLLVRMSTGGLGPLWEWAKYMFWKRRETSTAVVQLYLIWAADTWLHVTTTTVLLEETVPSTSSVSSFGRQLSAACSTPAASIFSSCNINPGASAIFLVGGSESLKVISNQSSESRIFTAGLSEGIFSFVTGETLLPSIDFSATTFASNVSCIPISRRCGLEPAFGASTPFNCSDAFSGDVTSLSSTSSLSLAQRGIIADFFYDSQLTQEISLSYNASNPSYFALATIINQNDNSGGAGGDLSADPEIVVPVHGGNSFVLSCQVELYEMQYTYSNGSVTRASLSPANNSVASLFLAPFLATNFGDPFIENAILVAGISNTSQQVADKFALSFSRSILAATAGVLEPQINIQEQLRVQQLVARVPIAPLFTLVGANAAYALLGLIITIAALRSSPRVNSNVRERLSVLGLVANLFEFNRRGTYVTKPRELFEESHTANASSRVGMLANDQEGWEFAVSHR